jgi:hypothetical protein
LELADTHGSNKQSAPKLQAADEILELRAAISMNANIRRGKAGDDEKRHPAFEAILGAPGFMRMVRDY